MAKEKFVVIKSGAHEYLVEEGGLIEIEKIPFKSKKIVFSEVLLSYQGDKIKLGKPTVSGAKVEGEILHEFKAKKVITVKFKAKKRYRRTKGHRQKLLRVKITKI